MIHLIFHMPPTSTSMREATEALESLADDVGKAERDDENDVFFFVLNEHREVGAELKQLLEEKGFVISVKDQGVYLV